MDNPRQEFDEQAALQALEQLRDQIQRAREARERKEAEFDAFVRQTRAASQTERTAALNEHATPSGGVQAAARSADRAADQPLPRPPAPVVARQESQAVRPEPRAVRPEPAAARPQPAPSPSEPPPVRSEPAPVAYPDYRAIEDVFAEGRTAWWQDRRYQLGGGAAALLLLLLMVWTWGGGETDAPDAAVATPAAQSAETASPPPAAGEGAATPEAAQPAVPARPLEIELTTLRPVWMRIIVDGVRRVEREVPANQTLTFGADRTIVLRVGDAGGVRLTVNGTDQGSLGGDGQIAVRTLTPPQR